MLNNIPFEMYIEAMHKTREKRFAELMKGYTFSKPGEIMWVTKIKDKKEIKSMFKDKVAREEIKRVDGKLNMLLEYLKLDIVTEDSKTIPEKTYMKKRGEK